MAMLWFIFTFYLITGEEAPLPIPSAKLTTGSDVFFFFACCTAKGMNKKVHVCVCSVDITVITKTVYNL